MIRAGVIGLGFAGKIHVEKLLSFDFVQISALCDIDKETGTNVQDMVKKISGKKPFFHVEFHRILPHCDIVFVATPAKTHYQILKEVISAGKHVFVEKPLTTRFSEGKELEKLAQEKGVMIQVGHVERFNDAYMFGKQYVKLPGYIKAERLSQFPGRGTDTDVIFDLMIHDIDVIVGFLKNQDIDNVESMGVPILTEKPDIAMTRIKFTQGCIADLTASRVSYRKFRKMRIFQPGVYVSIDFLERRTEIYRKEKENSKIEIKAVIKTFENSDPMKKEIESFLRSVLDGRQPEVSLQDALRSVSIAEKVREAMIFMPENSIG